MDVEDNISTTSTDETVLIKDREDFVGKVNKPVECNGNNPISLIYETNPESANDKKSPESQMLKSFDIQEEDDEYDVREKFNNYLTESIECKNLNDFGELEKKYTTNFKTIEELKEFAKYNKCPDFVYQEQLIINRIKSDYDKKVAMHVDAFDKLTTVKEKEEYGHNNKDFPSHIWSKKMIDFKDNVKTVKEINSSDISIDSFKTVDEFRIQIGGGYTCIEKQIHQRNIDNFTSYDEVKEYIKVNKYVLSKTKLKQEVINKFLDEFKTIKEFMEEFKYCYVEDIRKQIHERNINKCLSVEDIEKYKIVNEHDFECYEGIYNKKVKELKEIEEVCNNAHKENKSHEEALDKLTTFDEMDKYMKEHDVPYQIYSKRLCKFKSTISSFKDIGVSIDDFKSAKEFRNKFYGYVNLEKQIHEREINKCKSLNALADYLSTFDSFSFDKIKDIYENKIKELEKKEKPISSRILKFMDKSVDCNTLDNFKTIDELDNYSKSNPDLPLSVYTKKLAEIKSSTKNVNDFKNVDELKDFIYKGNKCYNFKELEMELFKKDIQNIKSIETLNDYNSKHYDDKSLIHDLLIKRKEELLQKELILLNKITTDVELEKHIEMNHVSKECIERKLKEKKVSFDVENSTIIVQYENGDNKNKSIVFNNQLHSTIKPAYEEWYHGGKQKCKKWYIDGILSSTNEHPTVEEWYENGNKKCEKHYINGMLENDYTTWHNNGNIKEKGFFKNGKLNSIINCAFTEWFDNGKVKCMHNMIDGEYVNRDGFMFREWSNNGELIREKEFFKID